MDWSTVKKSVIFSCDCACEQAGYFEVGEAAVKNGYRETAPIDHARFGYRVRLPHVSKPHLLEVHYPDDLPRMLLIGNGSSYDLSCGVFTEGMGGERVMYNLFWPRWEEETVVFCSWHGSEPAAVSSFSVYELDELPSAVELPHGRRFGVQYEDPCNIGAGEGAFEFYGWLDRHVNYMKMTGQDRLVYPIHWYHGPQVPVDCQPHEKINTVIMPDRKFYSRSKTESWDWLDVLLDRFDREQMKFTGSLTLLRLGHLMKNMQTDMAAIRAGADTYNNMRFDGQVQTSTNDWTPQYSARIYPDKLNAAMRGEKMTTWGYGERRNDPSYHGPIFNVLHPEVQRQMFEYFSELAHKYAKHPSFEGLSINVWHSTLIWYGNLRFGYDDYSFSLFEKETGLMSGIVGENRFERRYEWVMAHYKELFIDWRCRKITEFIRQLRDVVVAARPDLTLTVSMWNEPACVGHMMNALDTEEGQYGNRQSQYEIYRNGGIDLKLLSNEPNIILSIERNACRDRSKGPQEEKRHMFTDMGWLDKETYDILESAPQTHNYNMNSWCEAWGKHSIFSCENDPNVAKIKQLPDYAADFVFRENSYYDDDKECSFGYDGQIRITAPFPVDYAEYLTAGLALHDALSITTGGLYLDKAHAIEQLAFAKEYRKLPPVKFHTVLIDPVAVRWHESGLVYTLSREPYPITIRVNDTQMELAPFELKVWKMPLEEAPTVQVHIPAAKMQEYGERAMEAAGRLRTSGNLSAQKIAAEIDQAASNGQYTRLRHLLNSYYVKRFS
jgi:hypothetical protein